MQLTGCHTSLTCRDGGAVIAQKLYNNFKQFRLYDLSDHKANYQQLLVGAGVCACSCV